MEKQGYQPKKQYRKKDKYSQEEEKHGGSKYKYVKKSITKSDEQGFTGSPNEWFDGTW